MTPALTVTLTPAAEQIVANFPRLPGLLVAAIARGMDKANQLAVANIQRNHLTGQGPFPVEEHRLGGVTNRLRGSVYASGSQEVSPGHVQSAIGSNVVYAAIHEFGGRIHHEARAMKVRHKRVRETTVQAEAYDTIMPERAPFRTGLAESRGQYTKNISRQIVLEWQKMNQ